MGCESFCVVRFDLGPLVQGQMRIAKLKIASKSLIIASRGLGWNLFVEWNLFVWSDLTFGPSYKVKRGQPNFKLLNLLIIGPRGLQYDTNSYEILG